MLLGVRSSTGYAITTSASTSFEHQTKTFGNPGNVARSMMKDIFLDMLPTMEDYQRKSSVIKGMRKLGKRLYLLAVCSNLSSLQMCHFFHLPMILDLIAQFLLVTNYV